MDLMHILTILSHQITKQNNAIQEHIMKNDMNFQRVVQENEDFKRNMRSELDGPPFVAPETRGGFNFIIAFSEKAGSEEIVG